MLAVQPVALGAGDEELAAVRVGARIGHREEASVIVLELEILILKFVTVD